MIWDRPIEPDEPTDRQMNLIDFIEESLHVTFEGRTYADADEFIKSWKGWLF